MGIGSDLDVIFLSRCFERIEPFVVLWTRWLRSTIKGLGLVTVRSGQESGDGAAILACRRKEQRASRLNAAIFLEIVQ
jgi:hypothetical protein